MFFIINIDARSEQLLYNTGRTALIVHNAQGVVLSFDFSCVSVFVDVFSLALLIQQMTLSLFQGYSTFTLGQISLLSILITCTQLQHKHTQSDPSPQIIKKIIIKTEKKQYNVKDKKLKQYNPPQKYKKCTHQKKITCLKKKNQNKTKK